MLLLLEIADILLDIIWWVIIIQVVLSWLFAFNVLNTQSPGLRNVVAWLDRLTAPIYRPLRAILPDFGGLDFSPLILLLAVQVIQSKIIHPLEISQMYGATP